MIPPRVLAWLYLAGAVLFVTLALRADSAELVAADLLVAALAGMQADDWFDRAWIAQHRHFTRQWRDGRLVAQRQVNRQGTVFDFQWGER